MKQAARHCSRDAGYGRKAVHASGTSPSWPVNGVFGIRGRGHRSGPCPISIFKTTTTIGYKCNDKAHFYDHTAFPAGQQEEIPIR
jgi:hypothetical protein